MALIAVSSLCLPMKFSIAWIKLVISVLCIRLVSPVAVMIVGHFSADKTGVPAPQPAPLNSQFSGIKKIKMYLVSSAVLCQKRAGLVNIQITRVK